MSPRRIRSLELVAVTLIFLAWWLLIRYLLVQGDDFISGTVGGTRGGRPSLAGMVAYARQDYVAGTGRQAGTLFRLTQLGGEEAVRWALPLHQAVLAVALLWWTRRSSHATAIRIGLLILTLATFPILAFDHPQLMGATATWAQASFDYINGPALCLLAMAAITADKAPGRLLMVVLVPCSLIAGLMHESGSIAVLFAAVTLLITRSLPRTGGQRLLLGCLVAGALAQATAPGLWGRLGRVEVRQGSETGWRLTVLRGANALWNQGGGGTGLVLIVLVVLLAAVTFVRTRGLARGAALVAALATAGLVMWHPAWGENPRLLSYQLAMTGSELKLALVGIALAMITGLSLLISLASARTLIGSALPLVALLGAAGALAAPFAAGITTLRATLPTTLWLAATLFALIADLTVPRKGRAAADAELPGRLAAVVLAAGVLAALWALPQWWWSSWQGMRANHAVYARVEAQVARVHRGQTTVINFPASYPRPDLMYFNAYYLPRYAPYITQYYDLPPGTTLVAEPK